MNKSHTTRKPTYTYVKDRFAQRGYTLLSEEYINNRTKLEYICPRGHQHSITWHSFNHGCMCRVCYEEDTVGEKHYNWKGGARINNLPLYETYAVQLEKYQVVYKISQNDLELLGVGCAHCGGIFVPTIQNICDRVVAINNISKGDANLYCSNECKKACPTYGRVKYFKSKENIYKNTRSDQTPWANMIKERDAYTCQKCGAKDKTMYAHHIDPVINNPIESADIDNGITLCYTCHKDVHQIVDCDLTALKC